MACHGADEWEDLRAQGGGKAAEGGSGVHLMSGVGVWPRVWLSSMVSHPGAPGLGLLPDM